MRRKELDHPPARIGRGASIVSQSHAEDSAIGQPHVESMWGAGVNDEIKGRSPSSGCALFIAPQYDAGATVSARPINKLSKKFQDTKERSLPERRYPPVQWRRGLALERGGRV